MLLFIFIVCFSSVIEAQFKVTERKANFGKGKRARKEEKKEEM